jgi:hypothetical protein
MDNVIYNGVEWYQTQLDQLHLLLNTFFAISNTMNEYNLLKQQEQERLAQKQFFPIFNKKNLFYLQGHKHRNQNAHQIDKRKIQVLCVHNFLVIYIFFFFFDNIFTFYKLINFKRYTEFFTPF